MQSLGAIHEDLSRISSIFLAAPFLFFACELSVRRVLVDLAPGRAHQQRPALIGSRPSSSCPHCSWPPKVHRSSSSLGHWCSLAGFVPLCSVRCRPRRCSCSVRVMQLRCSSCVALAGGLSSTAVLQRRAFQADSIPSSSSASPLSFAGPQLLSGLFDEHLQAACPAASAKLDCALFVLNHVLSLSSYRK